MSRAKLFLFAQYGWVALVVAIAGVALYLTQHIDRDLLYGLLAGTGSFAYFVQKQKLEETNLFRELFESFNERYNDLNQELSRIVTSKSDTPLVADEKALLVDYFNLCAEEYLYLRRGFIFPVVWQSWYNGMQQYYANPRIRALWDKELQTDSYYGFTISTTQPQSNL
jgi:hypothetical protein